MHLPTQVQLFQFVIFIDPMLILGEEKPYKPTPQETIPEPHKGVSCKDEITSSTLVKI